MKQYETLTLIAKTHKRVSPSNSLIWDVITEEGKLVVADSKNPVREASTKLLLEHGWPQAKLITFKHQSSEYESFIPQALILFAENGLRNEKKRLEALKKRSDSAALCTGKGFNGFRRPTLPENLDAALRTLCELLRRIGEMKKETAQ